MQLAQPPDKNTAHMRHWIRGIDSETTRLSQQLPQYYAGFHARQPGANTKMNAVPKAQMLMGIVALYIQLIRVSENGRITVSRSP